MDKHRLRRAILEAVLDADPGAASFAYVTGFPWIARDGSATDERVQGELSGLCDHRFLVNLRPDREPLYRLTAAGRDQLSRDAPLDEYVWGELAL